MGIVSLSLPTPNIPINHGPKPGFEIPFKTSQKTFSPQKGMQGYSWILIAIVVDDLQKMQLWHVDHY